MQITDNETNRTELRIIKTARSEKAINEAVEQGYWPLVKPVIPSPDIKVKFAVSQNKTTGKITVAHDYRDSNIESPIKPVAEFPKPTQDEIDGFNLAFPHVPYSNPAIKEDTVIGWTYYYPYHFESPFAAYLIPNDLKVGDVVMLEDLIEDVVDKSWNQGDTYRLESCEAVWDGKEFILRHNPGVRSVLVG
jgi:hypothetical protein